MALGQTLQSRLGYLDSYSWIVIKVCRDIHGAQRMNQSDLHELPLRMNCDHFGGRLILLILHHFNLTNTFALDQISAKLMKHSSPSARIVVLS